MKQVRKLQLSQRLSNLPPVTDTVTEDRSTSPCCPQPEPWAILLCLFSKAGPGFGVCCGWGRGGGGLRTVSPVQEDGASLPVCCLCEPV